MKKRNLTFKEVTDLPTEEKYSYITNLFENLTYQRKDPMLYYIDLVDHVLNTPHDYFYSSYKYDMSCHDLTMRSCIRRDRINNHYNNLKIEGII